MAVASAAIRRERRPTATSRFGVSRRENHDASEFYERFQAPEISGDDEVAPHAAHDEIWVGDAREMDTFGDIADGSVALVVTSPPYFAGKEYETAIGEGHVPESYLAYLDMLEGVFAECVRKLEPGGRIAVNVANLGRRPYRSLSADVTRILEELGLLLRGEIIWVKGRAAGGSCAWGSFQRPGNPVLRDVSERIVVASKGRFDRALGARVREADGHPSVATISADEFMELTTDVWEFLPESATRVGHPAPFPVELPRRFVDLYTYEGDLVLDPFMGSGSTAVAAVRTGRHFVGFDTDPDYVAKAMARVDAEKVLLAERDGDDEVVVPAIPVRVRVVASTANPPPPPEDRRQAVRDGRKATDVAKLLLRDAGFTGLAEKVNVKGTPVDLRALDVEGRTWHFDVVGGFSNGQAGLRRTDTLWKAVGKANLLRALDPDFRLVLLTTDVPPPKSAAGRALAALVGDGPGCPIAEVARLLDDDDFARLALVNQTARATGKRRRTDVGDPSAATSTARKTTKNKAPARGKTGRST